MECWLVLCMKKTCKYNLASLLCGWDLVHTKRLNKYNIRVQDSEVS